MAEKLLMMALSPTMTEGTITKWKVAEGAAFKAGALLCEVETDKASMDYEAPKDAVLLKILLPEGGKAAVGDPIAVIGSAGEDPGPAIATASAAIPEAREAPKTPMAPVAFAGGAAAAPVTPAAEGPSAAVGPSVPSSYPPSSPLARSLARELGLDLRGVTGSGPGGRVVERDVRGLASRGSSAPQTAAPHAAAPASLQPGPSPVRRVPVSGKRAVIARRLSESFFTAPHFYLKRRADSGPLMALREAANAGRDKAISLNAFLVKLAAEAIARHPYVNSSWEGDSIVERSSIDIGLAVALPDGLITPLVRDCARKSVAAIDDELSLLIAKAKDKGLQPDEYEGAGFTISNLGSYGVEEFTAIINPPGSAILAVGAAVKEPFVREDGSIGVRRAMALTLGCDHRVIDGAAGARFLSTLVSFIENPGKALV
ncbi:MAG: dihydrolipoamide acetyltransferase family protein [Rectinemataceae bacterium]|jgi:pyruvate dehydrogenase E2 component (dihydrolipoamide acetyltransferase)